MSTVHRVMLFIGLLLSMAIAIGAFGGALGIQAKEAAKVSAFPITENIVHTINILASNPGDQKTTVELPTANCTVRFSGTYVETTAVSGTASSFYWLFTYEPVEAPDKIDCDVTKKKKIDIIKTAEGISVTEVVP